MELNRDKDDLNLDGKHHHHQQLRLKKRLNFLWLLLLLLLSWMVLCNLDDWIDVDQNIAVLNELDEDKDWMDVDDDCGCDDD